MTAMLVARLAVTVFNLAVTRWLDRDGVPDLATAVGETLDALRSVAGAADRPREQSAGRGG
jgi:hypothetical protein